MRKGVVERVEERVGEALERVGLAGRGFLLVVAVSGGPDSLALLHSLLGLRESLALRLHLAHLNHDFRGGEAELDAQFVSSLARELSLPATVEEADPLTYQRAHRISSFEEAAREVRYAFLARVAREAQAAAVALGHTADDQAETVLLHLLRGSGLHGLRGMEELATWRKARGASPVTLVRPLLRVSREETLAYCRKRGLTFRSDTSNLSLRFTRNRIRWKLMPTLRGYNPRIQEALLRLARTVSQELDYLEKQVSRSWGTVAHEEGSALLLDSQALSSLHPLVQRLLLRRAYETLVGDTRRLEEAHLEAMASLAGAPPGKALHLPRGVKLSTGYGQLLLGRDLEARCPLPPLEGEHPLQVPGETHIPGWMVGAEVLPGVPEGLPEEKLTAHLDLEALGDKLWVRTRRRGDRFQPLGMELAKKLQDFMVEEKIPRAWRDRVPLVVSGRGIAWVVGYRIAHWARVMERTAKPLGLEFRLL